MTDILKTLLFAMLPVSEIRGAIPVGIACGLEPWLAYAIGVVGNMLPVPILILLTRKVLLWMNKHNILTGFSNWLNRKGEEKGKVVQTYSFWGLLILVAIPLPGTGAWTGALVASLLDMRLKNALPTICLGVMIAGLIIMAVTMGVISVGRLF